MTPVYAFLIEVISWAYQIVFFLILALIPIRILIKALSGTKGSFL